MQNQKFKIYTLILALICFAVAALMAITPFLTLFKAEFLGFVESERGIDFFKSSTETIPERVANGITYPEQTEIVMHKSEILEVLDNAKFWNGAICYLQMWLLAFPFVMAFLFGIRNLRSSFKREMVETLYRGNRDVFIMYGVMLLFYYIIILFLLGNLNAYGDGIIKYTSSIHASMITAIVLCAGGLVVNNMMKNAINELPSVETVNQKRSIELISKYKELLDNGIITEEEYNAKKDKLLNKGEKL